MQRGMLVQEARTRALREFGGAAAVQVLWCCSVLAASIPARRAAFIDPMRTLRAE